MAESKTSARPKATPSDEPKQPERGTEERDTEDTDRPESEPLNQVDPEVYDSDAYKETHGEDHPADRNTGDF